MLYLRIERTQVLLEILENPELPDEAIKEYLNIMDNAKRHVSTACALGEELMKKQKTGGTAS